MKALLLLLSAIWLVFAQELFERSVASSNDTSDQGSVCPAAAVCAGDNCLIGVDGQTLPPSTRSAHMSECSSRFSATVYPSTVISSVTITTTVYTITGNIGYTSPSKAPKSTSPTTTTSNVATTVTPTSIPDYASESCGGNQTPASVRYSSACSCAGVQWQTTTLSTPTSTWTVTLTTTSTLLNFYILASKATSGPGYLADANPSDPTDYSHNVAFTTSVASASNFSLISGALELNGMLLSNQDQNVDGEPVSFDMPENIKDYNWQIVNVTVNPTTLVLTALNPQNDGNITLDCSGDLWLVDSYDTSDLDSCESVTELTVVPM